MKNFLGVDETPALERSARATTRLKAGLPTNLEMEGIPFERSFILGRGDSR